MSTAWRSLARRGEDAIRLVSRGVCKLSSLEIGVLLEHLMAANKSLKSLSVSQRESVSRQVLSWGTAFRAAVTASSISWMRSLARLADIHAKHLESAALNARMKEWRVCIGAKASLAGGLAKPSKMAYRWVRGLAGWQQNPIGDIEENDAVPDDPTMNVLDGQDSLHAISGRQQKVPLADQAAIEREANSWAQLWRCEGPYVPPAFS